MQSLVQRLREGIPVGRFRLFAAEVRPGRFVEETWLKVEVADGDVRSPLLNLMLYRGRPPYYRPWVEIFAQQPRVRLNEYMLTYFGSPLEEALLAAVAAVLGPGGRIFVECEADEETLQGMRWGFPEAATRLGFLLFRLGFTWFKGWYYPEGMREGGQKLQAEKPVDEAARERHLRTLREDALRFLARGRDFPPHPIVARAMERAEVLAQDV